MTSGRPTKKQADDFMHPLRVFAAGFFIPAAVVALMFFVELSRLLALAGSEGNWGKPFDSISTKSSDTDIGEWIIFKLLAGLISVCLKAELAMIQNMLYVFPILILIGYVFKRTRWGGWLLNTSGAMLLGFSLSLPVQILIMRLLASTVGDSYWAALVGGLIICSIPIIATIFIARSEVVVNVAGGNSTVDGNVDSTPTDDRPQAVKVSEDVRVNLAGYDLPQQAEQGRGTAQVDSLPNMRPQVADDVTTESEGTGFLVSMRRRLLEKDGDVPPGPDTVAAADTSPPATSVTEAADDVRPDALPHTPPTVENGEFLRPETAKDNSVDHTPTAPEIGFDPAPSPHEAHAEEQPDQPNQSDEGVITDGESRSDRRSV
jgi:hypothetical protein